MTLGQISLEYLSTYAWGIVILITVVGALGYFGFFNADVVEESYCNTGAFLSCEAVQQDTERVIIKMRNNMEDNIENLNIKGFDKQLNGCSMKVDGIVTNILPRGKSGNICCIVSPASIVGDVEEITYKINFEREGGSSPLHYVTGIIRSTIVEEENACN